MPADSYCLIAKPISYSSKTDSAATVAAVKLHDATYVCICEHDCPKPAEPIHAL